MQNKGFIKFLAVALTLICCFYLSFSVATSYVEKQAEKMDEQDLKLLLDWFSEHKDDKLNFIAKEAIKFEVKKANTVGDLLQTALNLLKKS